ncbi:MAG: hypothetical protein H6851_12445 [Geminicoccaceae bacterium]|nr:hypothetical protein [Geminicoccaceae bacterium]MCB9944414.1 hypothetical protein [Geminicoccaceae bacterium]
MWIGRTSPSIDHVTRLFAEWLRMGGMQGGQSTTASFLRAIDGIAAREPSAAFGPWDAGSSDRGGIVRIGVPLSIHANGLPLPDLAGGIPSPGTGPGIDRAMRAYDDRLSDRIRIEGPQQPVDIRA